MATYFKLDQKAYKENCEQAKAFGSGDFRKINYLRLNVSTKMYELRLAPSWSEYAAKNGMIYKTAPIHSFIPRKFQDKDGDMKTIKQDVLCLSIFQNDPIVSRIIAKKEKLSNQILTEIVEKGCPLCNFVKLAQPKLEKDQATTLYSSYGKKNKAFFNVFYDGMDQLFTMGVKQAMAITSIRDTYESEGKDVFDPEHGYTLGFMVSGEDGKSSKRINPIMPVTKCEYTGKPYNLDLIVANKYFSHHEFNDFIGSSKLMNMAKLIGFEIKELSGDNGNYDTDEEDPFSESSENDDVLPF